MNYEALSEQGPLLIISHGDFLDEMQSFVEWKNYKGIPTSIVDVSEIGDVDEMKLYIEDKYYEEGIAYVLLVGDIDQIDAISGIMVQGLIAHQIIVKPLLQEAMPIQI